MTPTETQFGTAPSGVSQHMVGEPGSAASGPGPTTSRGWGLFRLGHSAAAHPWRVVGAWLLIAVLVVGASAAFGKPLEESFGAPGLDSQKATDLLTRAGADEAGVSAVVVLTPSDERATFFDNPTAQRDLAAIQAGADELPRVTLGSDPAGAALAGPQGAVDTGIISPDGRVAVLQLSYPVLAEVTAEDLVQLKAFADGARESSLQVELGGELFFAYEEATAGWHEAIGLVVAAAILLIGFGSFIAMGLPLGTALFGLVVGVSALSLVNRVIDIPSWTPAIGAMVGIGVGIDYALFIVTRHREFMNRGESVDEAAGHALASAGRSVLFAGGIVVVSIMGLAVAGVPFMTAGGIAISVIVLCMIAASLTLLPAFLGLAGQRIMRSRRGIRADSAQPSVWHRWGTHVCGHAWQYAVGATVLLLALAAPMAALTLGTPDAGTLPEQRTERRAYDLVAEGFGPGVNGPLLIAVDLSSGQGASVSDVDSLRQSVAQDQGIVGVTGVNYNADAAVATFVAFPTTGPQDELTMLTVNRLRTTVLADLNDDLGVSAHVGGQVATVGDVAAKVGDRLPYFVGAVIALSLVLLTVVFRSVVVPIKAALMNLLSVGAAFGVIVMVFQWGWGAELIGLESTLPVVAFIPMFMFAILFGLSMDYEVFLLARIRESYLETGDNETSIVSGIASTGRVITCAALIMTSVFLGFVFSSDPTTKMFGLGLAVAIFIDATIVRLMLVPAAMKLMGAANWWMPVWLDRLLPHIDESGRSHAVSEPPVAQLTR